MLATPLLFTSLALFHGDPIPKILMGLLENLEFLLEWTVEVDQVVLFLEVDVVGGLVPRCEGVSERRRCSEGVELLGEEDGPADDALGVVVDVEVGVRDLEVDDTVDQQGVVLDLGLGHHQVQRGLEQLHSLLVLVGRVLQEVSFQLLVLGHSALLLLGDVLVVVGRLHFGQTLPHLV